MGEGWRYRHMSGTFQLTTIEGQATMLRLLTKKDHLLSLKIHANPVEGEILSNNVPIETIVFSNNLAGPYQTQV